MILGIDEVGRGPWAGPLVVGAVVLGGATIDGLADSKALSKKCREELDVLIRAHAAGVGLGWVSAAEIDEQGLSAALRLATKRAVEQITTPYHEIIIDGTTNFLAGTTRGQFVTTMKKADALVPSVSAASIVAKVARDAYMAEQDTHYDGYHFASHVGYGTAAHRAAIVAHGVTPLHRLSFAPLQKYQGSLRSAVSPATENNSVTATTKSLGDRAEKVVADYLLAAGHTVLARNWRTKFCEIDIISRQAETIYFTEVKYRKNAEFGDGLAAITPKKQRQMTFAATLYLARNGSDKAIMLAAASVTGSEFVLEEWVPLIN